MNILGKELDNKTVLEIGKFTILWAEFEKNYCNNECNSNAIWDFVSSYAVNEDLLRDLCNKLKGRIGYLGANENQYINYNLTPERARKPSQADLKTIEDFINFKGANLLSGAMLAIYRIRNNLLHGLKELSDLNEQIELFKSMNSVLENIRRK